MDRAFSLSVVMPAFNAEAHIDDALASLFDQTRRDIEILVVDDGSRDSTADRVLAWQGRAPADGPVVRLIRQDNAGPSAARNRAIEEAHGPLIGFLDADDRWAADKVEKHLELMARHPGTLLSVSGFHFIDETGAPLYEIMLPPGDRLSYAKLLERNAIHTSAVIARKSAIDRAGRFDTGLRTYEDFDLWLRIARQGPDAIRTLREPLTAYRRHSVQATKDWRKMHGGWKTVIARHEACEPAVWRRVRAIAWGHQLEYCASLAYNAGEIAEMRRLIRQCWKKGGLRMVGQYYTLLMTVICLATFLPRPVQRMLGRGFVELRKLNHALSTAFLNQKGRSGSSPAA